MPETIQNNNLKEMDIAALLSLYVYQDEQSSNYQGKTIGQVFENCDRLKSDTVLIDQLEDVMNFQIIAQSSIKIEGSDADGLSMDVLIACAFRDNNNGNVYVVYRGTGDGKWVDNGIGMAENSTLMQKAATEFYDNLIEKKEFSTEKIIVTGHSKGGNLAQFVTMTSKYAKMINKCYSFDGQGFSPEAIENFKNIWGIDYNIQIDKMYSINGENDYVHDLGIPIIRPDRTYYIKTEGQGFNDYHAIEKMISNGNLNWSYKTDESGNLIIDFDYPQGCVGEFARVISDELMELDHQARYDCAVTIMSLLEVIMDNDITGDNSWIGTGDVSWASADNIQGFLSFGIPLIVNTLINYDDSLSVLKELGVNDDLLVVFSEVQQYINDRGITDFAGYIADDPLRIIEIYSSLDLSKDIIHKAISDFCTPKNFAKIGLTVAGVATICPTLLAKVTMIATGVAAVGTVALIANHIYKNWDKYKTVIKETTEKIMMHISDKFNELCDIVSAQFEKMMDSIVSIAQQVITKGKQIINSAVKGTMNFLNMIRDKAVDVLKKTYSFTRDCIYRVVSCVAGYVQNAVSLNYSVLSSCVERMRSLASRVSAIDERLDSLYLRLIVKDIEEKENVFTSIANIYNLARADLNVDQASIIRRKARAIEDLYEGYLEVDSWVNNNLPGR